MLDIINSNNEKAILVAVKTPVISRERLEEQLSELQLLAKTAGAEISKVITQDRIRPDTAYFVGKGKASELAEIAEDTGSDLIIFDDDLSPTQVRNLERVINRKILDRSGLILDIFAAHARTSEAKTQVELAQLEYMLPRLTRAWTHLSKQYGGIGTKGPGETQIETDRRIIRRRIALLKEKLRKIESLEEVKSARRKDFFTVSLVGYTNAGKSTLLNKLTNAGVLAEDKLFATLDSTTRSLEISDSVKILLSDTVGFIRKLPHHLIASFHSTLKVARDADVILHVIDISHPFFEDHIKVVNDTLEQLGLLKKRQLMIFNKIDNISGRTAIEYVSSQFPGSVIISAERGMNIAMLIQKLEEMFEKQFVEKKIRLSASSSVQIAKLRAFAEILDTKYDYEYVDVTLKVEKKHLKRIENMLNEK